MSIIHDALKKVQTNTTNIQDTHTIKLPPNKKNRPQQAYLVFTGLTAIAGIIFFSHYISPAIKVYSSPQIYPKINKTKGKNIFKNLSTKPITPKALQHTFKKDSLSLSLNGTMVIEDKKAALINNRIYKIGDMIDGKKIVNITLEGVELLDGDKLITLKQSW